MILNYLAASAEVRTDYTDPRNVLQSAVVHSVEMLSTSRCEFRTLVLQ